MRNLEWKALIWTAMGGLLYGGLTLMGWIQGSEYLVAGLIWTAIACFWAFSRPQRAVRHAFVAGFIAVLLAVWLQAAFLDYYFSNNPGNQNIEIPFALSPRVFTVLFSPVGALFGGSWSAVFALLSSWLAQRLTSKRDELEMES